MYLTHIDSEGNDSPAILIDNTTASNRAVNLPEFVNIAGDGIQDIQVPAVDLYQLMQDAMNLEGDGKNDQALLLWKKALAIEPDDFRVQNGVGMSLYIQGKAEEGIEHLRKAVSINPSFAEGHFVLGKFLLEQDHPDQALPELETAITLKPRNPAAEEQLANTYEFLDNGNEALVHWRKALELDPRRISALAGTAWLLSTSPDPSLRDGAKAVIFATNAKNLSPEDDPNILDALAAAYAESRQFQEALATANRALSLAVAKKNTELAAAIRSRILLYQADKPYRDRHSSHSLRRVTSDAR
jgi:tetratricopeptide (TPR) repeat protein